MPTCSHYGFIFPRAGIDLKAGCPPDVQHLLGHASVKTTEKAYAAFVKNERFKQTIELLDDPVQPRLEVVR